MDFQYVGGGPGIRDVAYLLHGSSRRAIDGALDDYFGSLCVAFASDVDADALEREWRSLFPVAIADFDRFLDGWRG